MDSIPFQKLFVKNSKRLHDAEEGDERKVTGEKNFSVRSRGLEGEGRPRLMGHLLMGLMQNLKTRPKSQGVPKSTWSESAGAPGSANNAQGKIGRKIEQPNTHFKGRDTCIVNGVKPIHR